MTENTKNKTQNENNLNAFFNPKSVAVVGVSDDPTKLGSIVFNNMVDAGYKGKLYPINPKHSQLYWHTAYPSLNEVPEDSLDLVCIVVPTQFVLSVMKDCVSKKAKAVIIITAGFKEVGEEGKKLEEEIYQIAKANNIRIIGPNCLGIISPAAHVNASFAAATPTKGRIAFLSQSGAFCTAILDMALPGNVGFSHFVSFGNKCDVDEVELLEYLMNDPNVKVIGAYLEELKYGQEFLDIVRRYQGKKPVVLFKPGNSDEAKKAISSHTGSMAGSLQTFKTAMAQNGVIEATDIREFFHLITNFSRTPLPQGLNVGIVTNAGGPGIIATDMVIEKGFKMAKISPEAEAKLRQTLPATSNFHNPIDVIGDALADRYQSALQILGEDPNVDAILVIITPQLVTQIEETAKIIINSIKVYQKPILPILIGDKYVAPGITRFFDKKLVAFREIKDAMNALSAMYKYQQYLNNNLDERRKIEIELLDLHGKGKYHNEISKLVNDGKTTLSDDLVTKLAQEVGLDLPKQNVCSTKEEAIKFSSSIYPVVMKATNEAIAHKTDFKAVYLDIKNEAELIAAYDELANTIKEKTGNDKVEVLIQELIKYEELFLIGANRDGGVDVYNPMTAGFGHLIVFGQGGIYTEIYKDLGYALAPATDEVIRASLEKTKIYQIMQGARGKQPLAIEKVIEAIKSVQKLVLLYPEIASLDINPLLLSSTRATAVDIKIFV